MQIRAYRSHRLSRGRGAMPRRADPRADFTLPPRALGIPSSDAIDLLQGRAASWPVRDQLGRNTCIAMALTAALELRQAGDRGAISLLSAEFLYDMIRTHCGPRDDSEKAAWDAGAVHMADGVAMLAQFGICPDQAMPYLSAKAAPKLPQTPPIPDNATRLAERHRSGNWTIWDYAAPPSNGQGAAATLIGLLQQGRPVAMSMPEFVRHHLSYWDNAATLDSGVVATPGPGWDSSGSAAHAVCVVGYQPDSNGGWFIFRNSLGCRFGSARNTMSIPLVPAAGFGAIAASHVDAYCYYMASPA